MAAVVAHVLKGAKNASREVIVDTLSCYIKSSLRVVHPKGLEPLTF